MSADLFLSAHEADIAVPPSTAQPPTQVVFDSVVKTYRPRHASVVGALDGVSFEVRRGEVFGIIGRSGAGKSTLIRLINGLEQPDSGLVMVEGVEVGGLGSRDLIQLRRRVGMIFQSFNLLSSRSVLDNVALPLRLAGIPKGEARRRALEMLDLVGLGEDKAHVYPGRLSGGQKQRAGIARALVQKPDLLLSDEATSALDPETTRSILALLKDINRRFGLTIILITHEMAVIRDIADRVAVIEQGRIVETGTVWQVFGNPQHETTRALLSADASNAADIGTIWPGQVLFDVDYAGAEEGELDLFALANILGPSVRLIQGGVERLQGHAQGRLLIAASVDDPTAALVRLRVLAPRTKIIRHAQ